MDEQLFFLDIKESGKKIGEKLFSVLDAEQKRELTQFIISEQVGIEKADNTPLYTYFSNSILLDTRASFTEIYVKELYFCLEQRRVTVKNREIELTVKEFDLLALLIMHPKRVFTYEMLMDLVWHEDYTFYSRKAVNNHVSNLRKKLKISPDSWDYVKNVYGVGYKFDV